LQRLKLHDALFHIERRVWCFEWRFVIDNLFLFFLSSLSPPHWILCWPWKKSTSSFYFMTFHIWPSMFWFLSLIITYFIKFNLVFNFIIGFITLIFNFFRFGSHSLYFYFLFRFFYKFDFSFQFYPSIQSFIIFNVRPSIFWFQILIFSPFIKF